ncbi:response regulator transcription factor [Streptomyces sp. ISL-98]|uniref:LuxR C-terminal-related transcriptional regulator n=1 Tax=Streptomyces sp. ISL-98 TaxID=2819192 RepID=UPI0020360907|nr:response regulator transcription factor [Streptomyces sp. ISL-98]
MSMSSGIHVLVVADRRLVAEVLVAALEHSGITGSAVTDMNEVHRAVARRQVDVAVVDLDSVEVGEGGIDGRFPWTDSPGVPVVVVTGNGRADSLASAAVQAGVRGWVSKDSPIEHLGEVIRGVLRDETWIPPALLTRILSDLTSLYIELEGEAKRLSTLTAREREVLMCMCAGMPRPKIARHLFLSPYTVRTHIQNLMVKLDVHSSLAAVALARRVGLPTRLTDPEERDTGT